MDTPDVTMNPEFVKAFTKTFNEILYGKPEQKVEVEPKMNEEKSEVCGQCVILFYTHALFQQFKCPACPTCQQPIVAGDLVHLEPTDGRIMYSHAECFHFVDTETAV